MTFHLSNLGSLSATVQGYADNDGFIPELGDHWQQFKWCRNLQKQFADKENGEIYWQDFVTKAMAATIKAERALDDLKYSDRWHRGKRRKG